MIITDNNFASIAAAVEEGRVSGGPIVSWVQLPKRPPFSLQLRRVHQSGILKRLEIEFCVKGASQRDMRWPFFGVPGGPVLVLLGC